MKTAIVIPVYKEIISFNEERSLRQCAQVLKNYPIILVAPKNLNIHAYQNILGVDVEKGYFDSDYFKSVLGYSRLLTSRRFYKAFSDYDYILIYQLDAWVFTDDLLTWAKKGYDYVGAPWLEPPPIASGKKPIINLSKWVSNRVGNGGFSLRNVKSHIRWAPWIRFLFYLIPKNEDILWSLFAPFKKPKPLEALHFAFELQPARSFAIIKQLPFGCHAWEKYDAAFWEKYIGRNDFSLNK